MVAVLPVDRSDRIGVPAYITRCAKILEALRLGRRNDNVLLGDLGRLVGPHADADGDFGIAGLRVVVGRIGFVIGVQPVGVCAVRQHLEARDLVFGHIAVAPCFERVLLHEYLAVDAAGHHLVVRLYVLIVDRARQRVARAVDVRYGVASMNRNAAAEIRIAYFDIARNPEVATVLEYLVAVESAGKIVAIGHAEVGVRRGQRTLGNVALDGGVFEDKPAVGRTVHPASVLVEHAAAVAVRRVAGDGCVLDLEMGDLVEHAAAVVGGVVRDGATEQVHMVVARTRHGLARSATATEGSQRANAAAVRGAVARDFSPIGVQMADIGAVGIHAYLDTRRNRDTAAAPRRLVINDLAAVDGRCCGVHMNARAVAVDDVARNLSVFHGEQPVGVRARIEGVTVECIAVHHYALYGVVPYLAAVHGEGTFGHHRRMRRIEFEVRCALRVARHAGDQCSVVHDELAVGVGHMATLHEHARALLEALVDGLVGCARHVVVLEHGTCTQRELGAVPHHLDERVLSSDSSLVAVDHDIFEHEARVLVNYEQVPGVSRIARKLLRATELQFAIRLRFEHHMADNPKFSGYGNGARHLDGNRVVLAGKCVVGIFESRFQLVEARYRHGLVAGIAGFDRQLATLAPIGEGRCFVHPGIKRNNTIAFG